MFKVDFQSVDSIISIISLALGILGVGLAVYYANKSKHSKLLKYDVKTKNVIRNNSKFVGLKLLYNDELITNYTISELWFWNKGNDIINFVDMSENDRLRLEIEEGDILDIQNVFATNKNNLIDIKEISKDRKTATISFDYIGKKEGAVLQIIHTGRNSSNIKLKGEIKGFGCPIRSLSKANGIVKFFEAFEKFMNITKLPKIVRYFFLNLMKGLGLIVFSIVVMAGIYSFFQPELDWITGGMLVILGSLYDLLIILSIYKKWPKGFNKYFIE